MLKYEILQNSSYIHIYALKNNLALRVENKHHKKLKKLHSVKESFDTLNICSILTLNILLGELIFFQFTSSTNTEEQLFNYIK